MPGEELYTVTQDCIHVDVYVTFHGKTYTNGYPLNGQKLTGNERITNAFVERPNGLLNVFNGRAKISNGLQKCFNA